MTKIQLDSLLQKSIPRLSLLYGESEFMISHYGNLILGKLDCSYRNMYFDEYDFDYIIDFLGVSSLFGDMNILRLKLYSPPNKKQAMHIIHTLGENANSYLIIELYKSPTINNSEYAKRFKAMSANFKNDSLDIADVRFYNPTQGEMIALLEHKANSIGVNINLGLLHYLLSIQNYDLSMAYSELDKFIYYKDVTRELIDNISYGLGNLDIGFLIDTMFNKEHNIMQVMEKLYQEGVEEMDIVRELHRYFYILFKLYGYSKSYGRIDSKEALGYVAPPQMLNTWAKRSLKIHDKQYLEIFDLLNIARVNKMEGKDALVPCVIAIQKIL